MRFSSILSTFNLGSNLRREVLLTLTFLMLINVSLLTIANGEALKRTVLLSRAKVEIVKDLVIEDPSSKIWQLKASKAIMVGENYRLYDVKFELKDAVEPGINFTLVAQQGFYYPEKSKLFLTTEVRFKAVKRGPYGTTTLMEGKFDKFKLALDELKGLAEGVTLRYYYDLTRGAEVRELVMGKRAEFLFRKKLVIFSECVTVNL